MQLTAYVNNVQHLVAALLALGDDVDDIVSDEAAAALAAAVQAVAAEPARKIKALGQKAYALLALQRLDAELDEVGTELALSIARDAVAIARSRS